MFRRLLVVVAVLSAVLPVAAPASQQQGLTFESIAGVRSAFGRAIAADPLHAGDLARRTAAPYLQAGTSAGDLFRAQALKLDAPLAVAPAATQGDAFAKLAASTASALAGNAGLAALPPQVRQAVTLVTQAVNRTAAQRVAAFRNLRANDLAQIQASMPGYEPVYQPDGRRPTLIAGATQADLSPFLERLTLLRKIDQAALLTAAAQIGDALDQARVLLASVRMPAPSVGTARRGSPALATVPTPYGDIVIKGAGSDVNDESALLLIDLGGSDNYVGAIAAADGGIDEYITILNIPPSPAQIQAMTQTRIVLDVDGSDTYAGGSSTQGYGLGGGFGILIDDGIAADAYRAVDRAQGFGALAGIGALIDAGGNNSFTASRFAQGAGQAAGLGVLSAGNGNDLYTAFVYAQGTGYDGGSGTLVDAAGSERYDCTGTINSADSILPISGVRPTTACHGTGYGGQGFFVDGTGNDTYIVATSFGSMSLIGAGGLVDGGGTDLFDSGEWSNGMAVLGESVVAAGSGNTTWKSVARVGPWIDTYVGSNGEGYQGGVGVLDDAGGNDTYTADVQKGSFLPQYACSAGCAFADGVGVLTDGGGNDLYRVEVGQGAAIAGYAALIDAGGTDTYLLNTGDARSQAYGGANDTGVGGLGVFACGIGYLIDASGSDAYSNPVTTFGVRTNESRWNNGNYGRGMDGTNGIISYVTLQAAADLQTYVDRTACTIVDSLLPF